MKTEYRHIVLANSLSPEACRLALYKSTLVYWLGEPEEHKLNDAVCRLGEICTVEDAAKIRTGVKAVAFNFSKLTRRALNRWDITLSLMGAGSVDTKGQNQNDFFERYDQEIDEKILALKPAEKLSQNKRRE